MDVTTTDCYVKIQGECLKGKVKGERMFKILNHRAGAALLQLRDWRFTTKV